MDKIKLKNVIEAILIASDRILSLSQLEKLLSEQTPVTKKADKKEQRHAANDDAPAADVENTADEKAEDKEATNEAAQETPESANLKRSIKEVIEMLQSDYSGRAMELKEVASGYRFQVRQGYADYVGKLWEEKPAKYSRALLETLVLIAYRQPITRGEIEAIRGVSVSSHIVKTMIERDWVRVIGHRDVPGKPSIYGTTKEFLDYFNLTSLDELPSLADVKDLDKVAPELALDDTDGKEAVAQAEAAQPEQDRKQIEIRQARRARRMRRQFAQSDETASNVEEEATTSQENESDQVEMS